jgi:serine/threonine protein kinase
MTTGMTLPNKWTLGKLLGQGSCASVFEIFETKEYVAKLIPLAVTTTAGSEGKKVKGKVSAKEQTRIANTLYNEYMLLSGHLMKFSKAPKRPMQGSYGECHGYRFLLLQRLDIDLIAFAKQKPSISAIVDVGIQLINGFEELHNLGVLFIDVKPDNFMINVSEGSKLYFIDFGIASRYVSYMNGGQMPEERGFSL